MTGGAMLSVRERERRPRAGARALLGRAGECGRALLGRSAGPDRRERRNRPEFDFVFLFQNYE
jgi:hypothetical protein